MKEKEVCLSSVVELAGQIRAKQASPTEVVGAYLRRIDRLNLTLNAYCTVAAEQAMAAAQEAEKALYQSDALPPLLGVPLAIKDLTPTQGIRTTYGSKIFAHKVPKYDSVFVSRVKQAGAIVLGKTNTPEFGYTGVTENLLFGRTNNPWNTTKTAGGSSGGSAAAVAAGLAPAAEGSDGGGSIRIPAACCGLYGFKPGFGRIPFDLGATKFSGTVPFVHSGFLTTKVDDAAFLLGLLQGPHSKDPYSIPISREGYYPLEDLPAKNIRIAYSPNLDYFEVDAEVQEAVSRAAKTLEGLGFAVDLVSIGFEDFYAEVIKPFVGMWSVNLAAFYGDFLPQWETQMSKGLVSTIKAGQKFSAIEYKQLEIARSKAYTKVEEVFGKYDLLITPTLAVAAFPHGPGPREINGKPVDPYTGWMLTSLFNLTGHPAASINCGYSREGLPIGLQLVGPRFREDLVLQVSKCFEAAVPPNRPNLE